MDTLKHDSDNNVFWRLTADQRRQIYNEEKERIEQTAPLFSQKTKLRIALYILGCVIIYSGIDNTIVDLLFDTGHWHFKTENLESLGSAAIELIRPLLVGYITVYVIYMPIMMVSQFVFKFDLTGYMMKLFHIND